MSDLIRTLSLDGLLEEHRRSHPARIAAVFEDRIFTWPQLADRVLRLADALSKAGVGKGDRVLWLGQNTNAVLEGIVACARLGAMFCPANWRQSAAEIAFVIDDLQATVVIWQQVEVGEVVQAARAAAKASAARWIAFDDTGPAGYEAFLSTGQLDQPPLNPDPDLPCLIIYTAAFAGRPNGAMLSQTNILWQNLVLIDVQDVRSDTVFLNSGPLFHVGTLMITLATFHVAGSNVFIRRTATETIARAIHQHRCTLAFLMQQTCREIAEANRDRRYDLKCLRSPTVSPEWDAQVTVIPERSLFGYGQTEVMGPVTWAYYGLGQSLSRNGRTGPAAQLRILDEAGRELAAGETGEIAIRGPTVMHGYWNRPALNAQRQQGGWHRCNDLGRREADGSLAFVGPKTQMIKSGAENIYPAEVEGCLRSHPAVADVGVIGVPDDQWVQSVKAIVVLKAGVSATAEALIDHCRTHIASYKKPRRIEFAAALPRTALGALDYKALDAAYGGGNYPGGNTASH